jgi:hypothetical protein
MIRLLTIITCLSLGLKSLACSGCRNDESATQRKSPEVSASASASAAPVTSAATEAASAWPVPVGPNLAILPGKGVGAIRFGATIATIERLMEFSCEVKTDTLCGYNGRAIDFILKDGVTVEMQVHRVDRTDRHLSGAKYGVFNGRLLGGATPGMLQEAAVETLGAAQRVEPVTEAGPWGTLERHHYADMIVEYDKLPNGNVVLGGIVLTAPATTAPSASASGTTAAPVAPKPR